MSTTRAVWPETREQPDWFHILTHCSPLGAVILLLVQPPLDSESWPSLKEGRMKNLPMSVLLVVAVASVSVTAASRAAEQKHAKSSTAWNLYVPSQIPWKPAPS